MRLYRLTRPGWLPCAALTAAILAASMPARSGTGVPDEQLWSELAVVAPLGEKTSVTGAVQLRLSEELPNPVYSSGSLDFNYKAGSWTLSLGYRHQVTGDRGEEDYPNITQIARLTATYAWRLDRATVLFRTRLENTLTASGNPWRVRLRGEYRWATQGLGPIAYLFANDEVFYQFSDDEWFRNRFRAGMDLIATKRTDVQLFYQRQDSKNTVPGAINALGVTGTISF